MHKYKDIDKELIIEFASGRSPRVREVVKRSNCRVTGKFPSMKNKRMMQWESFLEWNAFLLFEYNRTVDSYSEQPATITYYINGEKHTHIPDLYVIKGNRRIFIEVKTDKNASDEDINERTKILKKQLPYYGFEYQVLVESEIKQEPRLSNIRYLIRNSRTKVDIKDVEFVRKIYKRNENIKWGNVIDKNNDSISLTKICKLIIDGILAIPVDEVWTENTVLQFVGISMRKGV